MTKMSDKDAVLVLALVALLAVAVILVTVQ